MITLDEEYGIEDIAHAVKEAHTDFSDPAEALKELRDAIVSDVSECCASYALALLDTVIAGSACTCPGIARLHHLEPCPYRRVIARAVESQAG